LPVLPQLENMSKKYENDDDAKMYLENNLNNLWRPTLTVIGINGPPSELAKAGNVVQKELTFRMSMRTAPNHDARKLLD